MTATTTPADWEAPAVERYRDPEGRDFGFVHVRHPGSRGLAVHFSAFFGKWGDARAYRDTFGGYFHRLKMLGSESRHDWLFLCDAYGAFDNGSYYLGHQGDLFVERAMTDIIGERMAADGHGPEDVVMLGSSMGATAALKFGLQFGVAGVAGVVPHIDLDLSAIHQDRRAEVAWTLPDGDVTAAHNRPITRQIRDLVAAPPSGRLPRLFIQSCVDDVGVHAEQVLPLMADWQGAGGAGVLDARPEGGHTSDYASRALLLDVTDRLLTGAVIPLERYQQDPAFAGTPVRVPVSHRVRGVLGRARKRFREARSR